MKATFSLLLAAAFAALACPRAASAQTGAGDSLSSVQALVSAARALGLEQLTADSLRPRIGLENRRYRHPLDALGRLERSVGGRIDAVERRTGIATASYHASGPYAMWTGDSAIRRGSLPPGPRFTIRYPSDRDFPGSPGGKVTESTTGRVDLEFDPLFDYELGRVFEPWRMRLQLQAMLRVRTWPGGEAKLAAVIPIEDRFDVDSLLHPDIRQFRPGQLSFEQVAWIPRTALFSLAGGYFGENRYGVSLGAARPFAGGLWLADAQYDVTGFMAFPEFGGTQYSSMSRVSGFAGVTWRPGLDISVRGRAARFLYGDDGFEVQVMRGFGDLDLGFYTQRALDVTVYGWRVAIPVPPMKRPTGSWFRVVPVERFPLSYRSQVDPIGLFLTGVPSREALLRRLDEPGFEAHLDRYLKALGNDIPHPSAASPPASFSGTSGFVNTPWAGVKTDRTAEVGWNWIPKAVAYDFRGQHDNHVLYASVGFLPRTEMTLRWTVFPGYRSFQEIVPDSRLTDTDEMGSARFAVLEPGPKSPGLAIGIDDFRGTRRFHSTYAVSGMPFEIQGVQGRLSLGYAFVAFDAARHVLRGAFGAVEASPWRRVALQAEHDTEKWNFALVSNPWRGLQLRAALFDFESVGFGGGWQVALPR